MLHKKSFLGLYCAVLIASPAVASSNGTMTVVVPYSSGSVLDAAMRIVAEEYNKQFNQVIIIENKPGGGGAIAAQAVARSPANGKTILMGSSGMLSINPHTHSKLAYSPDDFKMITGFVAAPMLMAIKQDVPATNVKEFVEWVKTHPEEANYGSFSTGNPSHFAGYMLNKASGMELQNIPYTGGTRYIQDLVGGRLTSLFAQRLNLDSFYKEGRLKIIATSADERNPDMPAVQTFKEQGFPELSFMMWTTLAAPAKTDDSTVRELNEKFKKAMTAANVVQRLKEIDFEPMATEPAETHAFVLAESKRWKAIVDQTGFKVN